MIQSEAIEWEHKFVRYHVDYYTTITQLLQTCWNQANYYTTTTNMITGVRLRPLLPLRLLLLLLLLLPKSKYKLLIVNAERIPPLRPPGIGVIPINF